MQKQLNQRQSSQRQLWQATAAMQEYKKFLLYVTLVLLLPFATPALASDSSDALLTTYQSQGAEDFSAEAGATLWKQDFNGKSCTSCHSDSVQSVGKHQRTGKPIKAMAPSVNTTRLTDAKKIEKWFRRNCKWTMGRECSPQEKGDILTWLANQ